MLENAEKNAPGLLGEVALAGRFDNILYSWQCFGAEFWECPLPWMESNPTHGSHGLWLLHCWHNTGL